MSGELVVADCLDFYRGFAPNTLDASVEDPPAGIGFMGVSFDSGRGGWSRWVRWMTRRQRARLDACKPGAHALTWAIPQTADLMGLALRLAGWEIRNVIIHVFGQGRPAAAGAVWTVLKPASEHWILARKPLDRGLSAAQNVEKWGTGALNIDGCRVRRNWAERGEAWLRSGHSAKPEARKIGGAAPGNGINAHPGGSWPGNFVMSHCPECVPRGTRRVRGSGSVSGAEPSSPTKGVYGTLARSPFPAHADADGAETIASWDCLGACDCGHATLYPAGGDPPDCPACGAPRWWACPVAELDAQSGERTSGARAAGVRKGMGYGGGAGDGGPALLPSRGGASRFFPTFGYFAKAPTRERDLGCEGMLWVHDKKAPLGWRRVQRDEYERVRAERPRDVAEGNPHPTVKPLDLCAWLTTLVRPNAAVVPRPRGADGFCGSGSIPIAARMSGWVWDACDIAQNAIDIAAARLAYWAGLGALERPAPVPRAELPAPEPSRHAPAQLDLLGAASPCLEDPHA